MLVHIVYIVAACMFIFGLKLMSRVQSARRGNLISALAMLLAMLATLIEIPNFDYQYIVAGIIIGSILGGLMAQQVKMTAMPQMVALLNGAGGVASLLVAWSYVKSTLVHAATDQTLLQLLHVDTAVTIIISILIGSVTFTGSLMAFAKLQEWLPGRPLIFSGRHLVNVMLLLLSLLVGYYAMVTGNSAAMSFTWIIVASLAALLLGVTLVLPIGGADMPVVISLLNSYSGLAASMTGFVLHNQLLIIGGALVGASGIILTQIMCRAMNRSLINVMFGGFGAVATTTTTAGDRYENVKETQAEEAAAILDGASSVIVVPGYGLAVAQAQHVVREIAEMLQQHGCSVRYAIHPVAGRMPGHMNVLLAEANVPYDQLFEMERINDDFKNTDVVLVIGANDVINPAAASEKTSPIYGMPILPVHQARTVLVLKRSLASGFAGIRNALFEYPNTLMVFGDAKQVLTQILEGLKELATS